jgi:hypothetical protein
MSLAIAPIAVARLTVRQRALLLASDWQGRTWRQIARVAGVDPDSHDAAEDFNVIFDRGLLTWEGDRYSLTHAGREAQRRVRDGGVA